MEKTNELNKFLSYIHMGTSVFRIYYDQAKKLDDDNLVNLVVEIMEIFKTHEENITKLINSFGEEATNSLTAAGIMGLYKEKLKIFDDGFDICFSAIKSTNMGMISSLKFLKQNKELHDNVKAYIVDVIRDYERITDKLTNYVLNLLYQDINNIN